MTMSEGKNKAVATGHVVGLSCICVCVCLLVSDTWQPHGM